MSNSAARVGDAIGHGGAIVTGSGDVFTNGISAAYVGSVAVCGLHCSAQAVVVGSGSVFINGSAAAFVGRCTSCGAPIASGSGDVFIGG
ncbi:PAAR repeat-containing protein (plasmid) [Burkholderia ambifaria MC40-6]|uniref:PAAR repeat-containing protein n=1 Tax=Burkholderia ambifaria (strain MC40-6) TaxID=398577 RepID=B1Z6L0_BURA4|nr:PAAR domain-containing protein [Burkholderia ambifaria]ACB69087.1 PAAR repeat-containing protein [Burkholderia ambifaria MC40-6]